MPRCSNNLKAFPAWIDELKRLRVVSAMNNKLEVLTNKLCSCVKMEVRAVQCHVWMPVSHGGECGRRVQELSLQQNRLRALPIDFGELTALQKLFLDSNSLHDVRCATPCATARS